MALVFKVGDYHQMPKVPENFPTCSDFMPNANHKNHLKPQAFSENDDDDDAFKSNSNVTKLNKLLFIAIAIILYDFSLKM